MKINDIDTLIARIDAQFPFSSDSTNYGAMLRGVVSKTIVHDIIKDIVTAIDGISKSPYNMSDCKRFLYGYMNECIAKNFEKTGMPKIESFSEAYINIREHENAKVIKERIVKAAVNMELGVEQTRTQIDQTFDEFERNYKKVLQYPYKSNGYNQYLPLCKTAAAVLLKYKYDPYGLSYDLEYGHNIFVEVSQEQEKKLIEKRRKEREQRRKEEEEKQKEVQFKKEQRANRISLILGVTIGVGGLIALVFLLGSLGGGSDDGTVGNWFVAIIVLLALLKGGK